jgi:hypothetical protein
MPATTPPRARPWRPVLLSALGFPGLGQLALRRWASAALYGLGSLALVGLLLQRVVVETRARMPSDPDELVAVLQEDPTWPLKLAQAIQSDNAGFFVGVTAAVVVLWLLSVADAWRASRQTAVEDPAVPRVK